MVYERLPRDARPRWAGTILDLCRRRFPRVREVDELYFVTCDPTHWDRARQSLDAIRALSLSGTASFSGASLLFRLAEDTAKVTYNASAGSAPQDHNAGWRVAKDLHAICQLLGDPKFSDEAARAALNEYDGPIRR